VATREREQWHPPIYEDQDIIAVQTIAKYASGESDTPPSQGQCKRMLDWIINNACATYDDPFRPNCDDIRSYMLGRRSVGLAIIKLMKLNLETIRKKDAERKR
jgi:hypothetical protein